MNLFKHMKMSEKDSKNTAQKVRSKFVFYSALESIPIMWHLAIDGERTICSTAVYSLSLAFSGQFSQTLFLLTALQFCYFRWRCFQKDVAVTFAEVIWRVDLYIQAVVGFDLTEITTIKKLSIILPNGLDTPCPFLSLANIFITMPYKILLMAWFWALRTPFIKILPATHLLFTFSTGTLSNWHSHGHYFKKNCVPQAILFYLRGGTH